MTFTQQHGHFVVPTLLLNTTAEMRCMREEVFGPVLAVARAPTDVTAAIAVVRNQGSHSAQTAAASPRGPH